jgi:hypothetical protein
MARVDRPTKWAKLEVPDQFQIGLKGLAQLARWQLRRAEGGGFEVASQERYESRVPDLLRLERLADSRNAADPAAYDKFGRWQPHDTLGTAELRSRVASMREVTNPQSPTDAWVSFRLQFSTIGDGELAAYLGDVFPNIVAQIPTASLWAVHFDPSLSWRVAAVRMLFAAEASPEILDTVAKGQGRLPSPVDLMPSLTYGLNAFLEPMLLPASPWIVGMNSARRGGNAIVMFGRAEAGFEPNEAAETLNLLKPRRAPRNPVPRPNFEPEASDVWLRWWIREINALLGQALDVGRFTGENGEYRPAAQLGVLLSLEKLFTSVQSILADPIRGDARLWTFFDVIDLLDGLSFGSWENLLRYDKVSSQLTELEGIIPAAARELALTRVRPSVGALNEFLDGFANAPGQLAPSGNLRVRQRDGIGWQEVPLHSAGQSYLRLIRNATHSFRSMARDPHDVSLLASHLGAIPDALPDLAFMHLLRFLVAPRLPHD